VGAQLLAFLTPKQHCQVDNAHQLLKINSDNVLQVHRFVIMRRLCEKFIPTAVGTKVKHLSVVFNLGWRVVLVYCHAAETGDSHLNYYFSEMALLDDM